MRILLVGGTGVLGRATVPLLVAAGHDVHVTSRRDASDVALRAAGATPLRLDVFDPDTLWATASDLAPDAIVRLATHIPSGPAAMAPRAWRENDRIRRDLASLLADTAIAVGARYVGESITLAYADGGDAWLTEDGPLAPAGPVATVADAEAAATRVAAAGGVGVSLRFGLFHGAGSGQAELTIDTARQGWLGMPGTADGFTSLVDVRDAASAVVTALDLPSGAYNVVEDEPATRGDHAAALGELVGRRVRPLPGLVARVPRIRPVARSLRVDNAALRAHGWAPRVPRTVDAWPAVAREVGDVAA